VGRRAGVFTPRARARLLERSTSPTDKDRVTERPGNPHAAIRAASRAIKPYLRDSTAIASALYDGSVRRATPYRRPGKAGGIIKVSKSLKTVSIASRNAAFRWSALFDVALNSTIGILTASNQSWAVVALAGLRILNTLRGLVVRELTVRHGAVIAALWKRSAHEVSQPLEMLQPEVTFHLRRVSEKPIGKRELRRLLDELTTLGCVEPTVTGERWRLRDRVWLRLDDGGGNGGSV
jgi:hypothetical protein